MRAVPARRIGCKQTARPNPYETRGRRLATLQIHNSGLESCGGGLLAGRGHRPSRCGWGRFYAPGVSSFWSVTFRVFYRLIGAMAPLVRAWLKVAGLGNVVELVVVGRRTRRRRIVLLGLLRTGGEWYVGHPNGSAAWTRNLDAAGEAVLFLRGQPPIDVRPVLLPDGDERHRVIGVTWRQHVFPGNVIYWLARRHILAVGRYYRLEALEFAAPARLTIEDRAGRRRRAPCALVPAAPHSGTMQPEREADLPVRDLSQVKLAEHLQHPGCPICSVRASSEEKDLAALINEGVNDRGIREALWKSRGYCRAHAVAILATDREGTGGTTAAAILFASVLRQRLEELAILAAKSGRGLPREVERASQPARCAVCRHTAHAAESAVHALLRQLGDDRWAGAISRASFCLDHLLALWLAAAGAGSETEVRWRPIAAAQIERIAALAVDLEGLAHNSAYDRRELVTDAQTGSPDRAAELLGGTRTRPAADPRRRRR